MERSTIEAMAVGKRYTNHLQSIRRAHWMRHPAEGVWMVGASWVVPERFEDDPLSVACGCPLQGEAHVHVEAEYHSAVAAADALYATMDAPVGQYITSLGPTRRMA